MKGALKMQADQIDVRGNIVREEEPIGPDAERIKSIIYESLNKNGYVFEWIEAIRQPYQGSLVSNSGSFNLYIYTWRISNGGRTNRLFEKRIQISTAVNDVGFNRQNTSTQKTLLLGVYERDLNFPIFAAWDVLANKNHGKSKSCFVHVNNLAEAIQNGFYTGTDSDGNPVHTFMCDYLTAYVELIKEDGNLEIQETPEYVVEKGSLAKSIVNNTRKERKKRETKSIEALIEKLNNLTNTEREAVVKQRIGQGYFKELLLDKYNEKCCICGLRLPPLLVGSHIKRWAESLDAEKLDVNNGLLLCALHDALFDKFLISFNDNGQIIISSYIDPNEYEKLGLTTDITIEVLKEMVPYLEWHRTQVK